MGAKTPAAAAPAAAAGTTATMATAATTATTKAATQEGMDSFSRSFGKPQALVLDTKFDGAVRVDVWSGYAVCVKNRRGQRRVVQGPQTVLLAFDETLEALTLSTGTPKKSTALLPTVFLKVAGNQVSDVVEVVSADLVISRVRVTYRVGFEGDSQLWFVVDNYVKLLCEHAASIIKGRARKTPIRSLRSEIVDVVRDAILGDKSGNKAGDGRKGLAFEENGMRVFDVEVHACDIVDDEVRGLLDDAQHEAVRSAVEVAGKESSLLDKKRVEEITRLLLSEDQQTKLLARTLESELEERTQDVERRRLDHRRALLEQKAAADLLATRADAELRDVRLATKVKETNEDLSELERRQGLEAVFLIAQTDARVRQAQALSPDLTAALTRLGDSQLLASLSENFGELAAVEGRGLLETARKFLDFAPVTSFPALRGSEARREDVKT
jgi:major vault protein